MIIGSSNVYTSTKTTDRYLKKVIYRFFNYTTQATVAATAI